MSVKEQFHKIPESDAGKHWLFWLSLAAVSLTVIGAVKKLSK